MLIASLVIGVMTAYYLGLRVGALAALAAGALFLLGIFVPGKLLLAYGLVAVYTLGLMLIGPRLPGRKQHKADVLRMARRGAGRLLALARRVRK